MYLTFMKGDSIQRQGKHIPSNSLTMNYEENIVHQNNDSIKNTTLQSIRGHYTSSWMASSMPLRCRAKERHQSVSYLVIIHDCVEGFDPQRVDIPIQDYPGWPIVPEIRLLSQNGWEEACKAGATVANTVKDRLSLKYMHFSWKLLYQLNKRKLLPLSCAWHTVASFRAF